VVKEWRPLPPSQAIIAADGSSGALAQRPESAAHVRGVSPGRLKRMLAGDLDAVVLKALEKDPAKRYRRVEWLRRDIESFLNHEPVTARACSRWERAWSWVGRNRLAASSILVAGIALTIEGLHSGPALDRSRIAAWDAEDALRRVEKLLTSGLDEAHAAVPAVSAIEAKRALASVHETMLRAVDTLPDDLADGLGAASIASARRCAAVWEELGEYGKAADTIALAMKRAARRSDANPNDPARWREYVEFLRLRKELQGMDKAPAVGVPR
jgi:hypothetical protein